MLRAIGVLLALTSSCEAAWKAHRKESKYPAPPPPFVNVSTLVVPEHMPDNHRALYSCDRFVPGFRVDPVKMMRFNYTEAIQRLLSMEAPVTGVRKSVLDVDLTQGKYLTCGRDGLEIAALELVRPYQHCRRLVLTSNLDAKDYLQPVPGQEHEAFDPSICHLAFIDQRTANFLQVVGNEETYANWTLIVAEKRHLPMTDPRENSRMFKHLAPRLFPDAEWSLWIEPKIRLLVPASDIVSEHMQLFGSFMALFANHPRIGWFEEQRYTVSNKLIGAEVAMAQRLEYMRMGLKMEYSGLAEGSIVVRDHRHPAAHIVSCNWWNEVLRFPPRDMASFNFAHHMLGFRTRVPSDGFDSARKRGGLVLDRLWWNYYNRRLTPSNIHVAPRCRYNMYVGNQVFSRFQPVLHPNSTVHGIGQDQVEGVMPIRGGVNYRRFYVPLKDDVERSEVFRLKGQHSKDWWKRHWQEEAGAAEVASGEGVTAASKTQSSAQHQGRYWSASTVQHASDPHPQDHRSHTKQSSSKWRPKLWPFN